MSDEMKVIEIKGWIWAAPTWDGQGIQYKFDSFDYEAAVKEGRGVETWSGYKKVAEHSFIVEIPYLDARTLRIQQLEAERTQLRANFQRRVNEIEDQISKLQAIEYTKSDREEAA